MSCIVALKEGSDIIFSCDTQISGSRITHTTKPKWIKFQNSILAITGNDALKLTIETALPFQSIDITLDDVRAYTLLLNDHTKEPFTILIGGNSQLYKITNKQIIEIETFEAIGSGQEIALGSLFSSTGNPRLRTETAIRSSIAYKESCGGRILTEVI